MALHCYITNSSIKQNGDGDTESLLSFIPFMPHVVFISFLCPCSVIQTPLSAYVEM
jgi:hypothetical protein